MTCKKCGAEIMDDANFCLKCGEAVERPEEVPEPGEDVNPPDEDAKAEQDNPELTFHKGTQLGRITYKKIDTRVEITENGLQIEKKTKKIFRKEKTEERFIPFAQMVSARVHTVLDYWDTLYGVAFVAVGFLFNLWALVGALVCFWCGYGQKVEFLLRSGEKYSFPYQFGKKESSIMMELCNKAASRQTTTNDAGVGEVANSPAVVPNGRNTSVQDSASKRFGKMLKIVIPLLFAAAFIMVAVMLNRRAEKFDYIAAVKEHKPFAESLNLDYTYEDVFERYISGASWSLQETATGADVTVHGSAAGLDKDIAISVEVTTSSEVIVVDPKLVEFDGEKLSNEDDLVSFFLVLFQAYDVGYEDFTDILNAWLNVILNITFICFM